MYIFCHKRFQIREKFANAKISGEKGTPLSVHKTTIQEQGQVFSYINGMKYNN